MVSGNLSEPARRERVEVSGIDLGTRRRRPSLEVEEELGRRPTWQRKEGTWPGYAVYGKAGVHLCSNEML